MGRLWVKLERWRWRNAIQRGLAPVSVGLVLAGAITLAKGALLDRLAVVIAMVVFVTLLRSRINPAYLILGGAVVGLFAFKGMN